MVDDEINNSKSKTKKNRRSLRKNKTKKCARKLILVGFNSAGLSSKLDSFDHILTTIQPSVFFIQETKLRKQGKIKTQNSKNSQIFELIRKDKQGGGLAIGVVKDLEPVWISEGDDNIEVLVVEIKIEDLKTRCICAYGPQEKDSQDKKLNFWARLSEEVRESEENESAIIIQMDGNLWAGEEIIQEDPNNCNANGKLFKEFLLQHPNLTVVNSLEICEGKITRRRITKKKTEEAILDFFIVCKKIAAFIERMIIDEEKQFPLSRYTKNGKKHSDHNSMILYLDIDYYLKKPDRKELFNFKNVECQKAFFQKTEHSELLTKCFLNKKSSENQSKDWFKILNGYFYECFRKIRCKQSFSSKNPVVKLLEERSRLVQSIKMAEENDGEELEVKLSELEMEISKLCSEENRKKVVENFQTLSNTDGSTNINGLWNLKRKVFPKNAESLPFAKKNFDGRMITSQTELRSLYLETFSHRLRHRPIRDSFKYLKTLKDELCYKRLEIAKTRKSEGWKIDQLRKTLIKLKSGKSRDPHGLVNELFKPEVSGNDFQTSFLMMANKVRNEIFFPKFMQYADIVSIYKGKGDKLDLNNDRGIFIVNIFRSIIMKMVYEEKYEIVDNNMSDSNVGARKHKNIRNHLFVINGIINDVLAKKDESIDIQILDYRQCFDSMWLEETVNDLWEAGITDDNLALIFKANEFVNVGVKTPFGMTERRVLEKIVMQGEIFGPLCCSVQVDTFGKECIQEEKYLYNYKNEVGVPPLAMVDDLLCISTCGLKSVEINAFINAKTNSKKLQFGEDKCHKMHVGQKNKCCPDLYVDKWELKKADEIFTNVEELVDEESGMSKLSPSESEKYLGDIISCDGRNWKNILSRRSKGVGIVDQIFKILEGTIFGPYIFEVGLILRQSMFLNSVLVNSESWYGVKDSEMEQLEQVDEMLIRKLLEIGQGCPKEMLFLETGSWPLRFIVMSRRLMFLHYILNEDKESLVYKFLQAQIQNPVKNDWILTVQENFEELSIYLDLDEISSLSTGCFKSFVYKKIEVRVLNYLNGIKSTHSKVMHIQYESLKLQNYFHPRNQKNVQLSKFIVHARARMLKVRHNFKKQYEKKSKKCPLECGSEDTQEHLLFCSKIVDCPVPAIDAPNYQDLFSQDCGKIITIAAILQRRYKLREDKIKEGMG